MLPLLLLTALAVSAEPVRLATPTFELAFDADGRPASLRWQGRELADTARLGAGFTVQPMNRRGTPADQPVRLPRVSAAGDRLLVASEDGARVVTLAVRPSQRHLALRIVELKGFPAEETVRLAFELRTAVSGICAGPIGTVRGSDVSAGVMGLDWMTWAAVDGDGRGSRLSASWPYLWRRSKADPLGGFALFVCPAPDTLAAIGALEVAEGLPHPMHHGQWAKVENGVSRLSQMWFVFRPNDPRETEEALGYLKQANMRLFYLPQYLWQGPGLYQVKRDMWPGGVADLRAFSDRLRAQGILLGIHTGSAGLFMRDPVYGSPKPHPQLAGWGSGRLAQAVGAQDTTLSFRPDPGVQVPVIDPDQIHGTRPPVYNRTWNGQWLQIGDEVVQVGRFEATDTPTWRLVDCRRGANGSAAAAHDAAAPVKGLLVSYGSCFTPDVDTPLFEETADALARLVNEARLARISFDALEMSDYPGRWAMNRFMTRAYQGFDHQVACESSSGVPQYEWHISSYQNVGEGMHTLPRGYFEGYLANNCRVANDSFLPGALGAFTFRLDGPAQLASSPDEWEWLLSKAAGYDACFFFETAMEFFRGHGQTQRILDLVRAWEDARLAHAFSAEQRALLRDYDTSFRLSTDGPRWRVTPLRSQVRWLRADGGTAQVDNPYAPQPLRFELRVLPRLDRSGADNQSLLPADLAQLRVDPKLSLRTVDGSAIVGGQPGAATQAREVSLADYLALMGTGGTGAPAGPNTPVPAATTNAAPDHRVLILSTRHSAGPAQADWLPAQPLNLLTHRGVGLWVTGDGGGEHLFVELQDGKWDMLRRYVVPIDFVGRRWVEIPSGEPGCEYYDRFGWRNGWHTIKLGFDYSRIRRVSLGLIGVKPGTEATCAVEAPTALREHERSLVDPVLALGDGRLRVTGEVRCGEYLGYDGGDSATVLDANRHALRQLPARAERWTAPAGGSQLQVTHAGEPVWLRLVAKPAGPPFEIDDPTAKARQVYADICR
ncbi:MAG: hypothetical protein HZB16_20510 [Armatimonadetes bacterium]|nr:hypothetical protein [Armatimonadota bacterium]